MYLKLLEEAVLEQRGEPPKVQAECAADLAVAASIPDRYVPSPEQRMDLYRRIARIRSEEEADDLVDELIDRYGDPPRTVNNFAKVSSLCGGAAYRGRLLFSAGEKPYLALKVRKGEDALKLAARLVEEYRATPLPSPAK